MDYTSLCDEADDMYINCNNTIMQGKAKYTGRQVMRVSRLGCQKHAKFEKKGYQNDTTHTWKGFI